MQLGFVIDHSRCIGCHACTVACKSENDVPVGSFRTWVKYTEQGEFPAVRRSFAVLRCNQCSAAPCVTICPVTALEQRADGIVDVDPAICIGCKACTHGCPYDALYIHPGTGTAQKCHFCAHRTERGLAPACAIVCPTEAILPGDFDDPESRVSSMRRDHDLAARKPEAGTLPNVWYREVSQAGIDPAATNLAHGFLWSAGPGGERLEAQEWEALEARAVSTGVSTGVSTAVSPNGSRTTYDVPRSSLWGWRVTGYLWFKSVAAGVFPAAFLLAAATGTVAAGGPALAGAALASLIALAVTGLLLVLDLKRPARFWHLFVRPNWSSWLARGTFVIAAYGALLALAAAIPAGRGVLGWPAALAGLATASYTGFLFAQAKGRVLWMRRGYWLHLAVQAVLAGSALLVAADAIAGPLLPAPAGAELAHLFLGALVAHLAFTLLEGRLAPAGREREYHRAAALVARGPWALAHWFLGVGVGVVLPALLVLFAPPALLPAAGVFALVGLWVEEHVLVSAGQALPIS